MDPTAQAEMTAEDAPVASRGRTHLTERPTTELLQQIDPRLRFSRNYDTLRPHGQYCEETISIDESPE